MRPHPRVLEGGVVPGHGDKAGAITTTTLATAMEAMAGGTGGGEEGTLHSRVTGK